MSKFQPVKFEKIYRNCGQHCYSPDELRENLEKCGFQFSGSGLSAEVSGPEDIMADVYAMLESGGFMADWDGPSETGPPNWHQPGCACFRCSGKRYVPPTVDPNEPTKIYQIRLPESLKKAAHEAGAAVVRDILSEALLTDPTNRRH